MALAAAACIAVAAAGCGSGGGGFRAAPPPAPASTTAATSAPRPVRARATAGGVRLEKVAGGLGNALDVVAAPGQPRLLLVVQQSGRVLVLRNGRVLPRPFLNVSGLITSGGERGLLGLAFHPGYARNGRFFVNYDDRAGTTQVVEYRRASATRADPRPVRRILSVSQPFANHKGGDLQFGPDGNLYVGLGDGGSEGDPQGNGQNLHTLLGKMLRIDVNARGARPRIVAYGLRNPWRYSFDRARGDLWIADVGGFLQEEIDVLPRGTRAVVNYGWNAFEGRLTFAGRGALRGSGRPAFPVAVYSHAKGCAVIGGFVYRGARAPALRGRYVFADYCSGRVWTVRAEPRPGGMTEITGRLGVRLSTVTSFGEGLRGDLYIIGNGALYRFTR